MMNVGL